MLTSSDLQFLEDLTRATVDASRVHPNQSVAHSVPNTTGQTLIRPGGRDCYPAFWVRDFSMSLDSGFITDDEAVYALRLIARTQNGRTARRLESGALIPPWSIPDHILFDGSPVFYPGTMSPADDQGGEPFGVLPPADDHYEFIHIAHWLFTRTHNAALLNDKIDNVPMLDRLISAFHVPTPDPSTGGMFSTPSPNSDTPTTTPISSEGKLVVSDTPATTPISPERKLGVTNAHQPARAVGFGFYDIVHLTGSVLFPSLLRHRAALELADLLTAAHQSGADDYKRIADDIRSHLVPVFCDPEQKHGWLLAATDIGRQPDVWGTLYALHLDLLPDDFAARARATIADAVTRNTITSQAAVRHIPTDHNFSPQSAWQKTAPGVPINTYQNGAYWHTPTGWLISVLANSHPDLARQLAGDYISHLRRHDFRQGPHHGAPFECFARDMTAAQNPIYMTSVTLPCSILRKMI